MYALFAEVLLTDKGKSLVRRCGLHWDAHKIHKDLLVYAETSTKASVESFQLITCIVTANLGDGLWRVFTEAFILHSESNV